jgi:uncharacterized membrane protein YfcA
MEPIHFSMWIMQVCASTAVLMILFSSSGISLSFYFKHMLNTSYATVFGPVAAVSSLVGVTVVGYVVRKLGRASIIIIILAVVIAAGTAATATFGAFRSVEQIKAGKIGFGAFCN